MKFQILGLITLVMAIGCKQAPVNNEGASENNKAKVTQTTLQGKDDIQVNTLQIGGESSEEKNKFQASYPQTKFDFINEIERAAVESNQKEFEEEAAKITADAVAGVTFGRHFEVLENSEDLIGFLHETYRSLGNTFSDEYHSSYYDLKDKKLLEIVDMFASQDAFEAFAKKAQNATEAALKQMLEKDQTLTQDDRKALMDNMLEQLQEGTKANAENYSAVVFRPDTIEVIFNKYQVAPGNMGAIHVKIPSQEVSDLLKGKYQTLFKLEQKKDEPKIDEASEETPEETTSTTASVDCGKVPCVALTFDDGPSVHTNRLLDMLKKEDVKATFFVLGKSAKVQPNTILRQQKEGHNVANHSWNHKDLSKLSSSEIGHQINDTNDAITEITGEKVTYLRPPYGAMNNEVKRLANMPIILWTIDPLDWKDKNADIVAERMIKAKANGIVLAHDIHKSTVDAVPQVIKAFKKKGFHIVSLDKLFTGKSLKKGTVYNKR